MYRWGDREKHSYVLGVFDSLGLAEDCMSVDADYRGGKYEGEILKMEINTVRKFKQINTMKRREV